MVLNGVAMFYDARSCFPRDRATFCGKLNWLIRHCLIPHNTFQNGDSSKIFEQWKIVSLSGMIKREILSYDIYIPIMSSYDD